MEGLCLQATTSFQWRTDSLCFIYTVLCVRKTLQPSQTSIITGDIIYQHATSGQLILLIFNGNELGLSYVTQSTWKDLVVVYIMKCDHGITSQCLM